MKLYFILNAKKYIGEERREDKIDRLNLFLNKKSYVSYLIHNVMFPFIENSNIISLIKTSILMFLGYEYKYFY